MTNTLFLLKDKEFNEDDFGAFLKQQKDYRQLIFDCHKLQSCQRRAGAAALSPDAVEIQLLANEFRYEHDLLTAEDLLHWLKQRDLNVEDFQHYIEQCYWLEHLDESAFDAESQVTTGQQEAAAILKFLHLSGNFEILLFIWQKKLLAWSECHERSFTDFEELRENFKAYCGNCRKNWDCATWVQVYRREFDKITLQLHHFETRDLALAAEAQLDENEAHESFEGYRAELPQWLQKNARDVFIGELLGPHLIDESLYTKTKSQNNQ